MSSAIYIPVWATAPVDEPAWFVALRQKDADDLAFLVALRKPSAGNVRPIHSMTKGTPRPAWYPPWAGSASGSNISATTHSGTNTRYYQPYYWAGDETHAATGSWRRYTAPAGVPACDKIVVSYIALADGKTARVCLKKGESWTVVGTVNTATGADNYRAEATLTLDGITIEAGDIIEIGSSGDGVSRINGMYAYDSTTIAPRGTPFALPDAVLATKAESSYEWVVKLCPVTEPASAAKFCGGYMHQGGVYALEAVSGDTWTVAGQAWTPVQGWTTGDVVHRWVSEIDYLDGAHTHLAGLITQTTFAVDSIAVELDGELLVDVDADEGLYYYSAMFAGTPGYTGAVSRSGETLDLTSTPAIEAWIPDPNWAKPAAAARGVSMAMDGGPYARLQILEATPVIERVFVSHDPSHEKLYFRQTTQSGQGDTWRCRWRLDFASSPLRMPMAALIASGVLGTRH